MKNMVYFKYVPNCIYCLFCNYDLSDKFFQIFTNCFVLYIYISSNKIIAWGNSATGIKKKESFIRES